MLEIRVLSGLHRGAALPLDVDAVCIGRNESNDLVLLDRDVQAVHLRLKCERGTWVLYEGNASAKRISDSGRFRVAGVWLSISSTTDPWLVVKEEDIVPSGNLLHRLRQYAVVIFLGFISTCAIMAAGWTVANELWSEADDPAALLAQQQQTEMPSHQTPQIRLPDAILKVEAAHQLAALGAAPKTTPEAQRSSAQEAALRGPLTTLKRLLSIAELSNVAKVTVRGGNLIISGNLSAAQLEHLQRVQVHFRSEFDLSPQLVIEALVKEGHAQGLPFRIVQVRGGSHPFVVTNEGIRLQPGDSSQGYKLVSVSDDRVVLLGAQRVEVPW